MPKTPNIDFVTILCHMNPKRNSKYNFLFQAFEELEALLAKSNICIAVKEKLVKDSGVAHEGAYDEIVSKLLTKPRARGK